MRKHFFRTITGDFSALFLIDLNSILSYHGKSERNGEPIRSRFEFLNYITIDFSIKLFRFEYAFDMSERLRS